MKFSERIGKSQAKTTVQLDYMDNELRNGLWNIITAFIIEPMKVRHDLAYSGFKGVVEQIWFSYFKEPTDEIEYSTWDVSRELRNRFFEWSYLDVYDFIDFVATIMTRQ